MKKLPKGWEWVKLGEISDILSGYAFDSKQFSEKKGTPLIRIRNILNGTTDAYYQGEYDTKYLIKNGDYLIGMDGEFNIGIWNGGKALLNQRVCRLKINVKNVNHKYIYYYMPYALKRLERLTPSVTVKHLSVKKINESKIPLPFKNGKPDLEKQQKIVAILEKAEQTIRLHEQAEGLIDELLMSIFYDMFGDPIRNEKGWEIITLGRICSLIKDGPHISPNYVEKGVPFITVHNIINGFFDLSDVKYITKEDHEEFCKRCKPEKDDILYSKGGTTGYAKKIDIDFEFNIWVHLALLKFPKDKLNTSFLESCLNSNYCRTQAKRYTRGIANRDLVLSQIAKIKIIHPPLHLQEKFSHIKEKIEENQFKLELSKQESETLFNALLQKVFIGELIA